MPEGSHIPMGEESPRLSIASISSDERAPSATPSDSSDLPTSNRRPVSLISTVSSGSGSSRDDNLAPPQVPEGSPGVDLNHNQSPERRGRSFIHNKNNAWTPNRASSRRQQFSSLMAPNPQLTYLDRVIMEIIETEKMYVRDLRMIIEHYLSHIIEDSELSENHDLVAALFGNIEDIYGLNSELLQDLEMCDNDPVAIASCFVQKREDFDIYTQYCNNYPNSVAALTECMRDKSLAKFFRDRQASLKRTLPLGSYLLKPVQRILKYHLLLQEIAKHFDPEDEEGYEVVEDAIYTMTGVAWYINDMKRKHEHAVRLQEVQSLLLNWKGMDLTTYGELILEGTFKVPRARHDRTLFLFDRMLLMTKRRGEHYVYKTHIPSSALMLFDGAKDSLSFKVSHFQQIKQPHTLQAKSLEEKKLWAHHIKRIMLENLPKAVPQKAKEAILEMDSICPAKYRYSPERLKKTVTEEFPREARQGRRQSEPAKQMLKRAKAPLEHANSEDAFPDDRRSLQGAVSSSTLGSGSLGESDVQEDGFASRGGSLERLACSEEELEEEAGRLDGFLLQDEQETEKGRMISARENGRHYEDQLNGPEATPEQQSADLLPVETPVEKAEEPEPEPPSDLAPSTTPEPPQSSEDLKPDDDPEQVGLPSSGTIGSDLKTLSSGESSEEEEDEGEAADKESSSPSILPSSVLDKASAIAQHFSNSVKRASLAHDDARSLGCPSPRLASRTGSLLSLRSESADRPPRLNSSSSDAPEAELSLVSPRDDGVFDPDRSVRRRRNSTLSKQDQLLIGKIKNYYENAGNQDAAFGLRRRESLTYIPSGLVRSSVSRFNSIPTSEEVRSDPAGSAECLDPPAAERRDAVASLKSGEPVQPGGDSEDQQHHVLPEEEFRPSSEMIKIWRAMERQVSRSHSEDRVSRTANVGSFTRARSCDPECEASDLSTITEGSTSPSPPKSKAPGPGPAHALRFFGEEAVTLRATVPRVAQLRAEAGGEKIARDPEPAAETDSAESKVRLLARRYSQRIRAASPEGRQAGPFSRKSLSWVAEEKESSGKPSLTLPLLSKNQPSSLPLSPLDPVLSAGPPSSVSPTTPIEGFSWPDVRQLRSRYSNGGRSQRGPTGRGAAAAGDRGFGSGLRRHSSGSSSLLHADAGTIGLSSRRPRGSRAAGREERAKRLQRANSLDPQLGLRQRSELQRLRRPTAADLEDGFYVAAEAPLTDDPEHKIIIVEKLPEAEKTAEASGGGDDGYVQIRSPTSREKISLMAVLERCRAYQESDAYKRREEARPHESSRTAAPCSDPDESQKTKAESGQKNTVKNLRERFQSQS
uniref:Pleckstrin homology and RhoGEF domain containing G3 n=1 Tax=Fundulus heteroclitus TaxID=8078 RepID=A0A3Q2PCQ4_FUNHE